MKPWITTISEDVEFPIVTGRTDVVYGLLGLGFAELGFASQSLTLTKNFFRGGEADTSISCWNELNHTPTTTGIDRPCLSLLTHF